MSLFRKLYPSELENIIDELDKENKLNEVHLKNLSQYISKIYTISISFSLITGLVVLLSSHSLIMKIVGIGAAVIFFGGMRSRLNYLLRTYTVILSYGTKSNATVTHFSKSNGVGGASWRIDYEYVVNERNLKASVKHIPNEFFFKKYEIGEQVEIYIDPTYQHITVPAVPKLIKTFNLRK